jgi:tRNA-2-methylthio-N6-dimethylallyladenosine synthase
VQLFPPAGAGGRGLHAAAHAPQAHHRRIPGAGPQAARGPPRSGETEAEHQGTLRLLEQVRYDFIYSFKYSPRPHTQAVRKYEDDVPGSDKKRRLAEVQGLQRAITADIMGSWQGQRAKVLVEGPSKKDAAWLSGRISQNWIVNFPAPERLVGQIVEVDIEAAFSNSMAGRVATRGALTVVSA